MFGVDDNDRVLILLLTAFVFFSWYIFIMNGHFPLKKSGDIASSNVSQQYQNNVDAQIKSLNTVSGSDTTITIEQELNATDLNDLDKELADIEQAL